MWSPAAPQGGAGTTAHAEETLVGAGGLRLVARRWLPPLSRGAVVLVHGVGEHSGRYVHVAETLASRGLAVFAYDHRGHGRSPGRRGHIDAWREYRDDLAACLAWAAGRVPAAPRFLYGHSLGALIVLDYVLHRPQGLAGAVVSAAPFAPVGLAKPALVALVRLLSGIWPRCTLRTRLDPAALAHDERTVAAYRADPLVHGVATARWGAEVLDRIAWVNAHAADLRLPLLLLHGEADPLHDVEGARRFYAQVPVADKSLRVYPGVRHEPHNDVARAVVLRDVIEWLEAHLPAAADLPAVATRVPASQQPAAGGGTVEGR